MTGVAPAERDLGVAGVRLRLAEAGAGRPVLLVHGNFASRRWWYEQLAAPPPGLRLVAPDLPNFGASDPLPGPITMAAYAEVVLALLAALDLDRPLLVGHSLGATVVERVALAHPEPARIGGLLTICGAPPTGLPRPEAHYRALAGFVGRREALQAALDPMCGTRKPAFWNDLIDDALAMRPEAYDGNARALGREGLGPAPARPPFPVTVLHGALDPLVTADMAAATAAHWPGARLVRWEDVGHSPALEAPERTNALLRSCAEEAAMT